MKPFINIGNKKYNGRLDAFYENIPYSDLLITLTQNTAVFLNELKNFENFKHTQSEKFFLLYREKGWNTTMLYSYGFKYVNNCRNFPDTISLLQPYQNILTIYFSTLESGTVIKPHFGDTDATYRIHLGLDIPAPLPDCGIEVGGIQKSWETGKTLIFNDAHFHSAWNLSTRKRTVLIIDVIRPEFLKRKQYISAGVLGAMGIGRTLYPLRIMDKLPNQLLIFLHLCSTYIFFIFLLIQNTFWNKKK